MLPLLNPIAKLQLASNLNRRSSIHNKVWHGLRLQDAMTASIIPVSGRLQGRDKSNVRAGHN